MRLLKLSCGSHPDKKSNFINNLFLPDKIIAPRITFFVFFLTAFIVLTLTGNANAWTDGENAVLVLGQTDFTSTASGHSQTLMDGPRAVAVDPISGKIFVCDPANHRVLRFASWPNLSNGKAAEAVLGQANFTDNASATSQTGLFTPFAVHVDSGGSLWVADRNNNRVLRFDHAANLTNGAPANGVLGQPNFTTNDVNLGGANPTASGMNMPTGVFADTGGRLWVVDSDNNRVLRFDNAASLGNGAPANGVLGQTDFTHGDVNQGGVTDQNTLNDPFAAFVDDDGRLWVADRLNQRVLRFDNAAAKGPGANADGVLGQSLFTTATAALSQNGFRNPGGVTGDGAGTLFVHDTYYNRVLIFNNAAGKSDGGPADTVLGQTDFTHGSANQGGSPAANTLASGNSSRLFYDTFYDVLWMPDDDNNRVLAYGEPYPKGSTGETSGSSGGCFIQSTH